jgi:hypothetical protein
MLSTAGRQRRDATGAPFSGRNEGRRTAALCAHSGGKAANPGSARAAPSQGESICRFWVLPGVLAHPHRQHQCLRFETKSLQHRSPLRAVVRFHDRLQRLTDLIAHVRAERVSVVARKSPHHAFGPDRKVEALLVDIQRSGRRLVAARRLRLLPRTVGLDRPLARALEVERD